MALFPRSRRDPFAETLESFGLAAGDAERLARAGTPIDVAAGTELCRKGEPGAEAFLLVDGEAVVELVDRDVTVGPGAVIGEIATLDPHAVRNATVVTTVPSTVLVYDVRTFRSLAASDLHDHLVPHRAA